MQRTFNISPLLLLVCLISAGKVSSQDNLVYNPSFEAYVSLPNKIEAVGQLNSVEAWYQPTNGSSDYFNAAAKRECGVPKNKLGEQQAHHGQAYCGIYCSKDEYREYLQTQLRQPLKKGCRYRLTFYVSLSEESALAISSIGALLTSTRLQDSTRGIMMERHIERLSANKRQTVSSYYFPQVESPEEVPLDDVQDWMCVCDTFTADGGEQYLTIGNFNPLAQSNPTCPDYLTQKLPGAYYFVDDVSLTLIDCAEANEPTVAETDDEMSEEDYKVGDTITLDELFFEFDKSVILQQSYKTLVNLEKMLVSHPTMRIEVQGHTDNKGSDSYNQRLSEARAKAVVDHLTNRGISSKRLQYKGFGASQPIDDNLTDEGRARNRRVVFRIVNM